MQRRRFSEERDHQHPAGERGSWKVDELCREHGIGKYTYDRRKVKVRRAGSGQRGAPAAA